MALAEAQEMMETPATKELGDVRDILKGMRDKFAEADLERQEFAKRIERCVEFLNLFRSEKLTGNERILLDTCLTTLTE